ncbi:iron-sulfur cluster assembly scaffold protein [Erythrobacter sp. THAF29]|uniref:iron-sulfur cluster assembly scaffold protein n=1 Tax=Erythrobacter sp. THAF29 TaxID=2587851 RepID=UPI0012694504|nr:iron-sulfur cluster assembly scaffold protein [Erythrobacter sp. THAF29]QFT77899.1 hypothetical protein FIU90_10160 [Erythrobacter sp. THAF29]
MAQAPGAKLYSPRLLALSAALADFPLDPGLSRVAEARSRTCGSTIALGIDTDPSGAVARIGMRVSACAVGQSSAAILALEARGKTATDFDEAHAQIAGWLEGRGELPDWPGFDALEAAQPYSGRHGALLMPWKAALEALST